MGWNKKDYLRGIDLRIEIYKARTNSITNPYSTRVAKKDAKYVILDRDFVRNIEYKGLEEDDPDDDILIEIWLYDDVAKKEVEGSRVSEKLEKPVPPGIPTRRNFLSTHWQLSK